MWCLSVLVEKKLTASTRRNLNVSLRRAWVWEFGAWSSSWRIKAWVLGLGAWSLEFEAWVLGLNNIES